MDAQPLLVLLIVPVKNQKITHLEKLRITPEKNGLEYKSIYAPEHTNEKLLDRQTLWNEVEKKEFNADGSMKANARLAKEYTCALPHELTHQERIKIVDDFCRDFVKKTQCHCRCLHPCTT